MNQQLKSKAGTCMKLTKGMATGDIILPDHTNRHHSSFNKGVQLIYCSLGHRQVKCDKRKNTS